jgi:fluoride exporter
MISYLTVFIGAGIGGALRHGVNVAALRLLGSTFPFGTLAVNIIGGLVMGLIVEWFALKAGASQTLRLFLTTGVLGGFTTFSAFSLETALMMERGAYSTAAFYAVLSVVASVTGLFAGLFLVRIGA